MLTDTIQTVTDWLTKNVCSKLEMKLPDDYKNDNEYGVRRVHPVAFPLFVPGKDRLPPKVPAPVPSVCVQLMEGSDDLFKRERTLELRLVLASWNPGTHGDEMYWPRKIKEGLIGYNYFVKDDEELQTYSRNMEGWKESMNFQDSVISALEKTEFIADCRIVKEEGIKFGLFIEDGDICDYYPYWHSWITFRLQTGLKQISPADYSKYL